jgi:AraC-like DNA-binding protein
MGAQELAFMGLAGSGIGTVIGIPMAWPRGRQPADVRLLGVATILMSLIAGLISAKVAGLVASVDAAEHAVNLLGLTVMPLVVVYMRQATGLSPGFRGMGWLWAPVAVYLGHLLAGAVWRFDAEVPFAWLLPVVLAFTAASAGLLWRQPAPSTTTIVPPAWIVGFLVLVNVAQILRMVYGHVEIVRAIVPLAMSGGFVAMVAYVAWRSATIAVVGRRPIAAIDPSAADTPDVGPPRYEKSGLKEADAADLLAAIDRALAAGRRFARPDLTLSDLARAAGSTPHLVSEALNRYAGESFHQRLTQVRVADVKAQLLDRANDGYTIEGIGASAGFGSRSALYAAFRRLEGMTPAAFRERNAERRTRTDSR